MDEETYIQMTQANFEKRLEVHQKRSADYTAMSDDVLSNFKRISFICHIWGLDFRHGSDAAMFHIIHKIDREMQLKKSGKTPQSESRKDTLLDLANYVDLYTALVSEE